jgi:hypothetical protein
MKRLIEISIHGLGVASIATMLFATLFVGSLSNLVRIARTARGYVPASFIVQRLAWSSGGANSSSGPGCWAVGVIGQRREHLDLNDCRRTPDHTLTAEVLPGQKVDVLYNPTATEARIQGEHLRVIFPAAAGQPWLTARTYAWKMYRPALFAVLPMLLLLCAARIAFGRDSTAGWAYGVVCITLLGLQVIGFAAMFLL